MQGTWKQCAIGILVCILAGILPLQAAEQPPEKIPVATKKQLNKADEKAGVATPDYSTIQEKKGRQIDALKREQGKELLRASSQLSLGLLVAVGAYHLVGGTKPLDPSMFISPIVGKMLIKPLNTIFSKLAILFIPPLTAPTLRKGINFSRQYKQRKNKLSPSMQTFLGGAIQSYVYFIENWNYVHKEYERAIEEVLKFPLGPKAIKPNMTSIIAFMKHYPAAIRITVGDFIVNTIAESRIKQLEKKAVPMMFVGPPGTGKTHLAKHLGRLMDLPVQIVDLSRYTNVNGESFRSNSSERGVIVDALLGGETNEGNFSNKLLVLDEVDKVLACDEKGSFVHPAGAQINTFLHTLLEVQETMHPLRRYGNASYDISQLKIILISNRTFTEVLGQQRAMALENRVRRVAFNDGFDAAQKLAIAQAYLTTRCHEQEIAADKVDPVIIESIVKEDTRVGFKGVRVMLDVINQYLSILKQGALISQIAGVDTIEFKVKEAYEKAKPYEKENLGNTATQ